MKKEILEEIKKVGEKLGIKLKDMLFNHNSDIVLLTDSNDLKKSVDAKIIMKGELKDGTLYSNIQVPDNYTSNAPLHLCFYLKDKDSLQNIKASINVGENSDIKIFAYCFAPNSKGKHIDNKQIILNKGSKLGLYELHFTTEKSYLTTEAIANVFVKDNAHFINEFVATHGHMGNIKKEVKVNIEGNQGKADLITRVDLKTDDIMYSNNEIILNGKKSVGIIKSNTVTRSNGDNYFKGLMVGNGDNSKGHVECNEILVGDGKIQTIPELRVVNCTSRLTHEASIGSIDKAEIDNLMAKGLSKEQAIDFVIKGILD